MEIESENSKRKDYGFTSMALLKSTKELFDKTIPKEFTQDQAVDYLVKLYDWLKRNIEIPVSLGNARLGTTNIYVTGNAILTAFEHYYENNAKGNTKNGEHIKDNKAS